MSTVEPAPRAPRIPLDVVIVRADDVEPGIYGAIDISTTGLCLMSERKERVGGFVALNFTLDETSLSVYAAVVWCRSDPTKGTSSGLYTVGLKFVTLSPTAQRTIQSYIDGQAGS